MTDARLEQEALLEAWMAMTAWIRGNRLLETFSMNEMLILSALVRRQELGGPMLTATELCQTTRLLKSQINHILTSMEDQGLIERLRSREDRRLVHLRLREEGLTLYHQEHAHVLEILNTVCGALGPEGTRQLTALLSIATAAAAQCQTSNQ